MDKKIALQVLKEARDVLNKINCPYFLMGGTLLGFIRENDFIGHDSDMDIGIFINDWSPKIVEAFHAAGFQWVSKMGTNELGLEYRFEKNNIQLDIFFWYKEADYFWYAAWWKSNNPTNIIKLKFDKFEIRERGYAKNGIDEFNIPSNYAHWLEQIYGTDWRVSKPDWHWCTSCQNIIQAPFDLNKEKKIVLGMIVKNEGKVIQKCLESAKGIIDYYVIVDTGSTDNTKEIIKETLKDIPGEIIDRPWINFGYNRTECAALCKPHGDYFLTLDADMELFGGKNLDKKKLVADFYMVYIYEANLRYRLGILMKNDYIWKSLGVTHEYWNCGEYIVTEYLNPITITHYCTGGNRPEKFIRDSELLEEGLKKEPYNARYMFYLGQTYSNMRQYEKAMKWYQARVNARGWKEEICYSLYMLANCAINLNRPFEEALNYVFKAYIMNPENAEPIYYLLKYCREHEKYYFGYYIGKIIENTQKPAQLLWIKGEVYDYQIADELSICAYYVGRYEESIKLCNKALEKCPESEKIRIIENKKFSENKLEGK